MCIDGHSNRGVRWKAGDPPPVFDEHFDPHGNQLKLQPGTLPLEWNSRDQLAKVTLLQHSNGLPDDEEIYRYSQGERVYKCSLTHTPSLTDRREVRYLPGLEIHTRNDGQQLHVIVLPGARCLHWVSGQPADIEADQLRYSLDDHLGSCSLELDRRAGVISQEFYYAFGGTAWWAARSALEASYKTIRYSGKEMDASGLYYYGARYYAPWLQRWVSADPAGDVDGLNLYAMVANNPLRYIDQLGAQLEESAARQKLVEHANFLATTNSELKKLNYKLYNFTRTRDIYKTAGKKLLFSVATFAVTIKAGAFGAAIGGGAASVTGPAAPVLVPIAAAATGIFFADAANKAMEKLGDETTLGYDIIPDHTALSVNRLKSKASAEPFSAKAVVNSFSPQSSAGISKLALETTARTVAKHLKVPYLKQSLTIFRQMAQLTEALNGSFGQGDLDQISAQLDHLDRHLDKEHTSMLAAFATLTEAANDDAPTLIGAARIPMKSEPHDLDALLQQTAIARGKIKHARDLIGRVSQHLIEKKAA
jgi:insecticidal toxin complex protein TccC